MTDTAAMPMDICDLGDWKKDQNCKEERSGDAAIDAPTVTIVCKPDKTENDRDKKDAKQDSERIGALLNQSHCPSILSAPSLDQKASVHVWPPSRTGVDDRTR